MRYLKYFENNNTKAYTQDFIINVGMFIDSIRKKWDNPNNFDMKMDSTSFRMFISGKYFHGKDIFKIDLRKIINTSKLNIWSVVMAADPKYFGDPVDCVKYIKLKIDQEIGVITTEKLEKLSKLKFNFEDMYVYLESEKYNL